MRDEEKPFSQTPCNGFRIPGEEPPDTENLKKVYIKRERERERERERGAAGYSTSGQVEHRPKVLTREPPTFTRVPAINIVSIALALHAQLWTGSADMARFPTLETLPASADRTRSRWGATTGDRVQFL